MPANAPIPAFDPLSIAISGTNLIEASAGTGKTYGIAALFTRLVVLEQMPVESILTVTFTKAATAELKTRLRARLDEVLQALESVEDTDNLSDDLAAYCRDNHPGDVFLTGLLKQALVQESRARLIVRLKAAIGQFDNAAIYTIHGFCQRILRDYAFLCRAPMDVELTEDNRDRLLIPAQDFWRDRIVNNPILAKLVFERRQTPQTMLAAIQKFVSRPYLVFRRPETDLVAAQENFRKTWEKVRSKLDALEETFWRIRPILDGNSYREKTFKTVFLELQSASQSDALPSFSKTTAEKLPMFAVEALASKIKKGNTPDAAAFADLQILENLGKDSAAITQAEEETLTLLHLDLLDHLNASLNEQKKSKRERGFDDLLLDVYDALTDNPQADSLAQAVAQNWRIALIDEFQDTDPLQYEIFRKIFISQNKPLFLVGDPKQAIYSFRGADIYAYLQAAADAQHGYTLATNYRSHAKLINGIGALFRCKNRPFVLDGIDYTEVGAARSESRLSPPRTGIQIRWLNGKDDEVLNKDILRRRASEYCADEIAHTLNEATEGRLKFKDRPVVSGDIAVLVRTFNEGVMVAKALKTRGIQSVLLSRESVFTTPEALALAALLDYWLNPGQIGSLRFVLSGTLFNYDAQALYQLNRNEAELLNWINTAAESVAIWRKSGIYAALQHFSSLHGIETGLLARGDERGLTNFHQLLECLSEEEGQSLSPAALHQWLNDQISLAQDRSVGESGLLRLESDEALVKIVTMHASKGLQYPLVYCPFVWDAKDMKPADWQILHTADHTTQLLAKSQLNEEDCIHLADEEMAERLRLLYVALTRAEEQLILYAAHCGDTADSPFAYLLEGSADSNRADTRQAYDQERKANKALGELQMLKNNWLRFLNNPPEHTDFSFSEDAPQPAAAQNRHLSDDLYQAAVIPARGFQFIRHTSFTGLSRQVKTRDDEREELQPALDPAETAAETERSSETALPVSDDLPNTDIHHFPRGANAGVCLHEMLEKFDFAQSTESQSSLIAETLTRYGLDLLWTDAVKQMLDTCRKTRLVAQSLSEIPPERRLPEMGFTLYTEDFKLHDLRRWFARENSSLPPECIEAAERLDFQDIQGFLNGFIDMVCQDSDDLVYIIDYKSNHLGDSAEAYTQQAMNEAVADHHYYLQALIYAIAVARYFKLRGKPLPKIAIRYLFLRGLDGTDNGIWQWDLDTESLAQWL